MGYMFELYLPITHASIIVWWRVYNRQRCHDRRPTSWLADMIVFFPLAIRSPQDMTRDMWSKLFQEEYRSNASQSYQSFTYKMLSGVIICTPFVMTSWHWYGVWLNPSSLESLQHFVSLFCPYHCCWCPCDTDGLVILPGWEIKE